uniref:Tensin-3-like n=1 Tax=Poecilia latipinna TaxID=48699 RepID=A0A3B3TIY5_9TELE
MEELRQIDLTYITECIISIICPSTCPEDLYLQNLRKIIPMLESKHGHNYMLINLSQKHDILTKTTHKIFNTGWLDLLAPSLDQIFNVCTAMENWLQGYPKHVLVLHCRGDMGKLGVLLASYIHFSNMSASADLSLDHFAMRKFYNDKLSALMIPSQKRYVWMVGSMLKGGLRMNPSPSFLLCVVLYGLPKTRPDEGKCQKKNGSYIFVKGLCKLELVVCYEKNLQSESRQVVFRLQFHMGLVFGHSLSFCKADLDCAAEDSRFPDDGKVELLFSESPEKIAGRITLPNIHVSDFCLLPGPPHVSESGNRDLYSKVRKKSTEEGALYPLPPISPSCSDRAPSASSDSGLSVASQGRTGVGQRRGATQDTCSQAEKLSFGAESDPIQALLEVMTELGSSGAGDGKVTGDESGLGATINGDVSSSERETDILDDEDEGSPSQAPDSSSVFSLPSEKVPATQRQAQTEYSTHSWVRQQQMVDPIPEQGASWSKKERPAPLELPDTPTRGLSSREAVKRGLLDQDNRQPENTTSSCQEDELASLNTDIDESIEQLNKLILDLDPTFVPVPTRCSPLSRSASLHTNGLSHKGQTHQSGNIKQNPCCIFIFTCSSTPPPVWHNRTPNSLNSPHPPQSTPPLLLSSPNAHSSPRGAQRGRGGSSGDRSGTDSTDLSSLLLLGNGGLEHSLLEAVEGLGNLNLGGDAGIAPLLPEKRRTGEVGELGSRSPSLSGFSSPRSGSSLSIPLSSSLTSDPFRGLSGASSPGADSGSKQDTVKFVQDTSKFWYKPDISRDQAIAVLKDKEPGSFIVRDSHSFRGAYGLAMKVATPPPSVVHHSKKVGDLSSELVRHFLIECTPKGVRLKGCPNEPYFGSLTALVCQHSITPLALPCKLILPDRDPLEELNDAPTQTATNSAAELLKQGAACNVWFLGSVELESLTGQQAVQKATTLTLSMDPPPPSTVVHFKVSAQGITLTDNQRKLFFRRHYTVNTVIFCSLDPQGRKWTRDSVSTAKIFGFVARKSQSETENVCHLFAEHDPEQPASAIVNFVSKVMIGSHKK